MPPPLPPATWKSPHQLPEKHQCVLERTGAFCTGCMSKTHRCISEHTGVFQNAPCVPVWGCTERTGVFSRDPVEYTPVRFRTHRCVLNSTVVGFEPGRAETCASKCCAQPIELPLHCLTMMNPSHKTRLSYHSSPLHGTPHFLHAPYSTTIPQSPSHYSQLDLVRAQRRSSTTTTTTTCIHVTGAAAAAEFSDDDQRSTLAVIVR